MTTIYLKRPNKPNQLVNPTIILNDVSQKVPFGWINRHLLSSGQKKIYVATIPRSESISVYGLHSDDFEKAKLTWKGALSIRNKKKRSSLGERLRQHRKDIIASGASLLDWEGVEREKADRRGGYQGE